MLSVTARKTSSATTRPACRRRLTPEIDSPLRLPRRVANLPFSTEPPGAVPGGPRYLPEVQNRDFFHTGLRQPSPRSRWDVPIPLPSKDRCSPITTRKASIAFRSTLTSSPFSASSTPAMTSPIVSKTNSARRYRFSPTMRLAGATSSLASSCARHQRACSKRLRNMTNLLST